MADYVTVDEVRSAIGIQDLYSDVDIEFVCQASTDLIRKQLWFNEYPIMGVAIQSGYATAVVSAPLAISSGQDVIITGCGTKYNGTHTITGTFPWSSGSSTFNWWAIYPFVRNSFPNGLSMIQWATTEADDNYHLITPYGKVAVTPTTVTPTTSVTPPTSPSVATFSNLVSRNFYVESSLTLNSTYSAASPVTFTSGNTRYNSTSIAQNTLGGNSTPTFTTTTSTIQNLTYDLSEDKTLVLPGNTILFTLVANGAPVPDNTVFNFALFGNEITNSDFQNNTTIGTMTMFNNVAKVAITIADKTLTSNKVVTFNVKEAARSTITLPLRMVLIISSEIRIGAFFPGICAVVITISAFATLSAIFNC